MSHFGELLKKARQRTWHTQKELGEKVGVDDSYISRLERGVYQPPSREVAEGLADATSMSNKPVTLYVSTKEMDAIDRFVFLLEANVAGAEDVKEIRLVKIEDGEAEKEEGKDARRKEPSEGQPAIAVAGAFGAGVGLGAILPRSKTGQQETDKASQQRDQTIKLLVAQIVAEGQLH
jgi:transcriptional regulator with XRE-family HTH domain